MRVPSSLVRWRFAFVFLLLATLSSCQGGEERPAKKQKTVEKSPPGPAVAAPTKIRLTSPAFADGQPIPKKYTGEGEDVSPPLEWSNLPEGTKQLALICDDPDAPRKDPWVHWIIYKIPAEAKGLPEGIEAVAKPKQPAGAVQGENSWPEGENLGYRGPMPPPGKPHRYFFKLYALDQPLEVPPELAKEELLEKISGHVIGQGQLLGTYQRTK